MSSSFAYTSRIASNSFSFDLVEFSNAQPTQEASGHCERSLTQKFSSLTPISHSNVPAKTQVQQHLQLPLSDRLDITRQNCSKCLKCNELHASQNPCQQDWLTECSSRGKLRLALDSLPIAWGRLQHRSASFGSDENASRGECLPASSPSLNPFHPL